MITISNSTIKPDAALDDVIGTFNVPVKLLSGRNMFTVYGKDLAVAWNVKFPPRVGDYKIEVRTLPAGPRMPFIVHVRPAPVDAVHVASPMGQTSPPPMEEQTRDLKKDKTIDRMADFPSEPDRSNEGQIKE